MLSARWGTAPRRYNVRLWKNKLGTMNDPVFPGAGGDVVLPVSALNRAIGAMLERNFPLAWISGEISNFTRAASGHWYFTIKDAAAQIRCVMFRKRAQYAEFTPREGDHIEVRATVTMYEPRGELQLGVEQIRRTGQGRLFEAFLRLKQKLEAEGLFEPSRKRSLPAHPRAIGIVTSMQAAALRDVLTTLARRAPHVPVIVYPSAVQGASASARLTEMVETAGRRREVDVLIVCRGGGSIEDLWAFNDEALARAIAASPVPVVSGVGHETDFTIADFAADLRAPTPTGAAEIVSPQRVVLLQDLDHRHAKLARAFGRQMERRAQAVDRLAQRLVSPAERIARQRAHVGHLATRLATAGGRPLREARSRFDMARLRWRGARPDLTAAAAPLERLGVRLATAMARRRERDHARLAQLGARVELLNPQRTFERGYAALLDARSGQAIRDTSMLRPGRRVVVRLAQGSADVGIADVQPRLDALDQ
jgi:exodeoxyribonuclease VII large subunit